MHMLRANLSRMLVFTRVIQAGSFSEAARQLGVTRSVVSEAVAALEGDLGCRLIHRSTRALRLTGAGEAFFERSLRMTDEAEAAFRVIAAAQERPTGVLRITAPGAFGERLVVPVLAELVHEHGIEVNLRVDDRKLNLLEEGFDAGIRVGRPDSDGQIVRKLGELEEVLVAAPELAERVGDVNDLNEMRWVIHDALPRRFTLRGPDRKRVAIRVRPIVTMDDSATFRALLCAGVGLGRVPYFLVSDALNSGALVRLVPSYHIRPAKVFMVLPTRRHLPLRTRLLIDKLKARIRDFQL